MPKMFLICMLFIVIICTFSCAAADSTALIDVIISEASGETGKIKIDWSSLQDRVRSIGNSGAPRLLEVIGGEPVRYELLSLLTTLPHDTWSKPVKEWINMRFSVSFQNRCEGKQYGHNAYRRWIYQTRMLVQAAALLVEDREIENIFNNALKEDWKNSIDPDIPANDLREEICHALGEIKTKSAEGILLRFAREGRVGGTYAAWKELSILRGVELYESQIYEGLKDENAIRVIDSVIAINQLHPRGWKEKLENFIKVAQSKQELSTALEIAKFSLTKKELAPGGK